MATEPDPRPVILLAVNDSETSLRAASYVTGLARGRPVRIVCLFVHATSPASLLPGAPVLFPGVDETEAMAGALRSEFRTRAGRIGLEAEFVQCLGDPCTEIVRVADELRVDTVVVGASRSLRHRLVGGVGSRLIRCGRWPVTVVP